MNIILSGVGSIGGSIKDRNDLGDIIEFPLMDSIDIIVDDDYYCSIDIDENHDSEIKIKETQYIKDHCLVKDEPPYFFRMVYGGFQWDIEFEIDDDDFDISKLEIIKNNSSIEELNAFIVDNIIYNGRMIHCVEDSHNEIYEYEMSDYEIIETEEL